MKAIRILGAVAAMGLATPVVAKDIALVVVNSDYDRVSDIRGSRFDRFFSETLEGAGFTVFRGADMSGAEMQRLAADFADEVQDGDDNRIVIVLAGHMAETPSGGWLLGRTVDEPNAFGIGGAALPLAPLAELAATAPGQAVVLLAYPDTELDGGFGFVSGGVDFEAPQGVTVARGSADDLLSLLRDGLLQPGASYAAALDQAGRGVQAEGYISTASGLTGAAAGDTPAPTPPRDDPDTQEIAYWSAVRDIGTVEALESYLERYPNGKFAADARRMIEDAKAAPVRQAEAIEKALNLNRDQRRQIQRNLALIGFDPRGIDGIFGPATRTAIGAWQSANNYERTTYLTAAQIDRIQSAADVRAAQLEREAAERRAAEERADRAYWRDLGQGADEASLRAYLKRYPDGVYSEVARERLDAIEAERADQVRREERLAWQETEQRNTIQAYQEFLNRFPQSPFAETARARIAELQDDRNNAAQREEAQRIENQVAGNPVTRLLVERRLEQLGFEPGAIDGQFDRAARRAIRRFQQSQGIQVTGFINQETMVRLLAVR
ncbi:hypothetical protein ATO6_05050 [Oceanicola sp. 22II-s10i]|uniref:peptidoglycan-binding domain-containing protein n=1 Tax=Oceanicola sp. 22II-s10i TaxID=1317116 RepID=UPI000B525D9F|nr:peptidoglycan-binding protein [Oceanicola sp. 22II-s10i]OWU86214.1 hypothetical protein ATO6_05050 [Oceanicola sp. 22II-s10i]